MVLYGLTKNCGCDKSLKKGVFFRLSPTLRELEMIDTKRIRESDYKTDPCTKNRRKKLKRDKCKYQDAFQHQEGVMYSSQGFYTT